MLPRSTMKVLGTCGGFLYVEPCYTCNDMSIFFTPATVKDIEKNLDITKPHYSEKKFAGPSALRYFEVPLKKQVNSEITAESG